MKLRSWYAVHGKQISVPNPAAIVQCIQPRVAGLTHDFHTADGRLRLLIDATPIVLVRRIFADDEEYPCKGSIWESQLIAWGGPHVEHVIAHVRQSVQLTTITPLPLSRANRRLARICEQICGQIAADSDGLIQVFQEGFFDRQGNALLPCSPKHSLKTS